MPVSDNQEAGSAGYRNRWLARCEAAEQQTLHVVQASRRHGSAWHSATMMSGVSNTQENGFLLTARLVL